MSMKKSKQVIIFFVLIFVFTSFANVVGAYPGSGQAKWEELEIQLFEKLEEEAHNQMGVLVNPVMKAPENFAGEKAAFGNNCLTCHGGDGGAHSPEQPYHGAITVDLIRTADNKSMVQEDGSLLIEVDPNGGVTNYKLVVGLSEAVYDGGYEDDRALAGWHFALPKGIHMDLPYCMHIIGPNLSKVYPDNQNAVFSDIKVGATEDFEEMKGILQIISGTQNATPNENKTYGSVVIEYKYSDDVPVEEGLTVADLASPSTPEAQLSSVVASGDDASTDAASNTNVMNYVYYGIIAIAVIAFVWYFVKRSKATTDAK